MRAEPACSRVATSSAFEENLIYLLARTPEQTAPPQRAARSPRACSTRSVRELSWRACSRTPQHAGRTGISTRRSPAPGLIATSKPCPATLAGLARQAPLNEVRPAPAPALGMLLRRCLLNPAHSAHRSVAPTAQYQLRCRFCSRCPPRPAQSCTPRATPGSAASRPSRRTSSSRAASDPGNRHR